MDVAEMVNAWGRAPWESELEHHKRIVYGKLVDKTLADVDYAELSEAAYGKPYSSDMTRRMMYGSCRTLQLLEDEAAGSGEPRNCPADCPGAQGRDSGEHASVLTEIERKKIELQKERQKFFDQRTAFNRVVRERAREEELNELIMSTVAAGALPELKYEPCEIRHSDNDLLVSLNDIHYGAEIKNYWNTYNSDRCAEMMRIYLDRVLDIAKTHRSENCIVWANGDLINGSIHHSVAMSNKENVIEQITGVSELIAEFLAALSPHFASVRFISVAGNHSRMDTKERALKDERLDDLVEWYLRARLTSFENILFDTGRKIDSTMYLIDVRGRIYVGVHGDYDGSKEKIHALKTMAEEDVYAVLLGHLHHNRIDSMQGVKTIMAGSFLGMDDYCVSRRIYAKPEQLVCVCDRNGIWCTYDVPL